MTAWRNMNEGCFWAVKLDVRDLGGHLAGRVSAVGLGSSGPSSGLGFVPGCLIRYSVPEREYLRWMLGIPHRLTTKTFLATLAMMISIFLLLMLSNLLTRLIGTFLTVPWGDLAFLLGVVRFTSLFTGKLAYGLSLLLVWERLGHGMGASPKVAHSVWFSWLRSMLLGVGIWKILKEFHPNSVLIISNAPPKMLTPYWMMPRKRFLMFRLWVRRPHLASVCYSAPPRPLGDAWWHGAIRMMFASGATKLDVRDLGGHLDVTLRAGTLGNRV